MQDLALYGGTPVRENKIFYGQQWIDDEDIQAVTNVLKSPFITQGPAIAQFEKDLCDYTGARYAVAISNGTAALHVACLAAGIGPGDEVITTPITFAASANCALYCGATPVFADINPDTYMIDPDSIEKCITDKTKAVVAVDFTGQAVEIECIRNICDKYNLFFIEDAAHSIGTSYKGIPIGNWADMTTFSFHPVKTITGGEGGAIMTNRKDLYEKLSLYRTHGITKDASLMQCEVDGPWHYEQIELGYNYRMTDFQAALLSSQLKKITAYKNRRKEIVEKYDAIFGEMPELKVQKSLSESDSCKHLYVIQIIPDKLNCNRREFFDALAAENIQPQVHYIPVYYFPYYQKKGYRKGLCPHAENMYENILSLPLYPKMTDQDVADVINAVQKVVTHFRKED